MKPSPLATLRCVVRFAWTAGACALAFASTAAPLEGTIWDTRSQTFISQDAALALAAQHPAVLLGEQHDSAIHHALQLQVLQALHAKGRRPALAMEQLDRENQAALDAALALPALPPEQAAERLAELGKLNKEGWNWPMYRDLLAFAAQQQWKVVAANLSRTEARGIAMGSTAVTLPPLAATHIAALEAEMVQGHCGHPIAPARLAALVKAQRARDATMAQAMEPWGKDGVVLIAGAGHVRRDRAAPAYFKDAASAKQTLTIAFVEVDDNKKSPQDYDTQGFDLLWFTPATVRDDPCAEPLGGSVGPAQ